MIHRGSGVPVFRVSSRPNVCEIRGTRSSSCCLGPADRRRRAGAGAHAGRHRRHRGAACGLAWSVGTRAARTARPGLDGIRAPWLDDPRPRSGDHRLDRPLSGVGARGRAIPDRVCRLLQHHAVVSLRRHALRHDGHQVGPGAAAGVQRDAAAGQHLLTPAAGADRLGLHPHAARAVRGSACRHHGLGGDGHSKVAPSNTSSLGWIS